MSVIREVYDDLDTDVPFEEFEAAVNDKVEQMGGLADEETAAMLIAHELRDEEVNGIADIEPGMEDVKFLAKVVSIGDVRTFERDGEDEDGMVVNIEVADETGRIRVSLWDEMAAGAEENLEVGTVLRIAGRPKDGFNGVEVSASKVEEDIEAEVDVQVLDTYRVEDLALGLSDVNLKGKILDTGTIRTFDRDDGSEGRVSNLSLGDATGRVRVTLWDERADLAEELETGQSVEVVDGYVRERDGSLELHVGSRGAVEVIDESIEYVPETTDIASLEIGQTADIAGGVIESDSKRTFDRDDGSQGQVRNIRVKDETGDIRVAMWGDHADSDVDLADYVVVTDVQIKDGWQDDLEASAGWRSTISVMDDAPDTSVTEEAESKAKATSVNSEGLGAFSDGDKPSSTDTSSSDDDSSAATGEAVEFTGTVVQAGNPVILDDGTQTKTVETDAELGLGDEVTVEGIETDGRIAADSVEVHTGAQR
ncbi:single-stranded DNA binding protein [Haloferax namakaokahaiae]|uniref:Single-stranded DNA binding protein n=1 Tax=Haloferax namakaokahaiae TaxID=1748331 RepID=A0ABD5ZH87_9EURY